MPHEAVFIFDSSYPSIDVALPIDEEKPHIVVSDKHVEPPPGHRCLQIHSAATFSSITENWRQLKAHWIREKGAKCIVIAAPGVRPEQLLVHTVYAFLLTRNTQLFDGYGFRGVRPHWRRLVKGLFITQIRRRLSKIRLSKQERQFDRSVRTLPESQTKEGKLFGLYSSVRSFSFPPDRVTMLPDGPFVYGDVTRGWYLPAFSSRRQRYQIRTTRHRLSNVTLHVEKVQGLEVSSLFKDGKILDYPYMLGRSRPWHRYAVASRTAVKETERGVDLLPYTSTYYHWLVEGVPRILDLIDDGFDFDRYPLILPPLDPFQKQILEILGIQPGRQTMTVDMGEWCHVGECIFPTASFPFGVPELEDPSGQPERTLLLRIRDRLIERIPVSVASAKAPERLYISRARAARRKFTEESETSVTEILSANGFQRVYLEDLSWPEQVQMLSRAKIIAAMHGAGITNILFSRAQALLEFHNPLEARPYFAVMARELGIRYAYIIGSLRGQSRAFDNITIDTKTLEQMVRRLTDDAGKSE